MAYTWTNKTKTGGVGITGKIVQKGKDDFPLMYANDLDWANVEIESGVNLNTTDDLLDYIKSARTTNTLTWTDEDLESATTGYELRCNQSVCYKGDTLSNVPITIWKSNGSLYVEIDYETATSSDYQLSLVEERPDVSASILLTWNASKSSLSGTVNHVGPYVFKLMKGTGANAVEVARHVLTVLTPLYKTKIVYIYKHSDETISSAPTGISYDFSTSTLTPPSGWSVSPSGLTGPIWVSSGFVSEESPNNISWNLPSIYLTHELASVEDKHLTKEIAVYKAVKSTSSAPNTPTGGSYSFSSGTFQTPSDWATEPNAAVLSYKSSASTGDEDNYKIWKSYNSYQCTASVDTPTVYGTVTDTGWTTPVVYLDIDGILNDADDRANETFTTALNNAASDLRDAAQLVLNTQPLVDAVNAIFAWRIVGNSSDALDSRYLQLVDTEGTDTTMDNLHSLFSGYYNSTNSRYEGSIAELNSNPNICIPSMEFKAIEFGSITDLNGTEPITTGKWVAYIPTTTELRTQIANLSSDLSQLNTTVNQQTPELIRLQASSGFLKSVTWTVVPTSEWTSACAANPDNGIIVTNLPTEKKDSTHPDGYEFGKYYRTSSNGEYTYYRCDYPISTGFANILADRVSFGVATNNLNSGDSVKGALIDMTVDGVSITGRKIVLNGDTVANAISGKSLNINNTTYLCSDGDVYMGVPNNSGVNPDASDKTGLNLGGGSSRFNHDGSGQLCGGNIHWSSNGSMWIKDAYIGNSNVWHIGQNSNSGSVPFIEANDDTTHRNLVITPTTLYVLNTDNQDDHEDEKVWEINRGGDAHFAYNNAYFAPNGDFRLGAAKATSGILNGGGIFYKEEDGTLLIYGPKVKLDAGIQLELGSGVQGVAINKLGSTVNGPLNTADVYIGGGKCFFKGDNAEVVGGVNGVTYGANTAGAGHLANGNIKWNKNGDVSVKGNIEADSMTIKAATFASIDNTTGKMWFTNYQSAKAISGGVIQNASVALRDDDPVILFKRLNENEDGYDFFVLNPLLLGNGAETIRTTQIGALDSSTSSATITDIIADKIYERYLYSNKIEKIDTTSNGSTIITFDSGSYSSLYMFRFVDAPCLYYDDSYNLIYHPFIQGLSQYDKVVEITRFSVSGVNNNGIKRESVYLYPAYSGNGIVESRMSNANGVGYFVSTSYSEYGDFIDPSNGYVHNLSTGQRTQYNNIDSDMKIMIKSDISGYDSVVYINNSFNYNSLFESHSSDINYVTTGSYSSGADPQLTGIIPSTTTISTLCYCGGNHSIFNS